MGYSPCGDVALTQPAGRVTPAAINSVDSTEGASRTGSPAARGPLRSALATWPADGQERASRPPQEEHPHPGPHAARAGDNYVSLRLRASVFLNWIYRTSADYS